MSLYIPKYDPTLLYNGNDFVKCVLLYCLKCKHLSVKVVIVRIHEARIPTGVFSNETKYMDAFLHREYCADHCSGSQIVQGNRRESCFGAIKVQMIRADIQVSKDFCWIQHIVNSFNCDLVGVCRDGKCGSEALIVRFCAFTLSQFLCTCALHTRDHETCTYSYKRRDGLNPTGGFACSEAPTFRCHCILQTSRHKTNYRNYQYSYKAKGYVSTSQFHSRYLMDEILKHTRTFSHAIKTELP